MFPSKSQIVDWGMAKEKGNSINKREGRYLIIRLNLIFENIQYEFTRCKLGNYSDKVAALRKFRVLIKILRVSKLLNLTGFSNLSGF
jgi:hypothetical protein